MTIERDKYRYVWTDSPESARRFFGVPEGTEVTVERQDGDRTCFAVRAPEDVRGVSRKNFPNSY